MKFYFLLTLLPYSNHGVILTMQRPTQSCRINEIGSASYQHTHRERAGREREPWKINFFSFLIWWHTPYPGVLQIPEDTSASSTRMGTITFCNYNYNYIGFRFTINYNYNYFTFNVNFTITLQLLSICSTPQHTINTDSIFLSEHFDCISIKIFSAFNKVCTCTL